MSEAENEAAGGSGEAAGPNGSQVTDAAGQPSVPASPDVAAEMGQIDAEMQAEQAGLQEEIDRRRRSEARFVPGSTQLDRAWKAHENEVDASLPSEEATLAARTAGGVAVGADEDRHEMEQDISHAGPSETEAERGQLAEAEKLAADAIDAGLRVSQDDLDARAARQVGDATAAKAAAAAAQTDLGRASRDLAQEDALLKQVEAETGDTSEPAH